MNGKVSIEFLFGYVNNAMEFVKLLVNSGHHVEVAATPFPEEMYRVTVFDCDVKGENA